MATQIILAEKLKQGDTLHWHGERLRVERVQHLGASVRAAVEGEDFIAVWVSRDVPVTVDRLEALFG